MTIYFTQFMGSCNWINILYFTS